MKFITAIFLLCAFFAATEGAQAELVEYQFDIAYKTVNFAGAPVQAIAVGGTIPAPTITATVGDTLRVTFHNKMDVESSIHWHGILLPNAQDGVPHLTTPPIPAGGKFTYEYPVKHHGTYWYHSHTGLQEQRGVYGALVFRPAGAEQVAAEHEYVAVLSDWSNENPKRIMHNLKRSDDYYSLKKNNVQSWWRVLQHGAVGIRNRLYGAWIRMGPMDISDVGYDAFLLNGKQSQQLPDARPGEKVRLRIINAAASSYFYVQYAHGAMQVVAADGVDVIPFKSERLRLAIAETYDVIVHVPRHGAAEFRASAEDGSGHSSLWLGEGNNGKRHPAPDYIAPNPFLLSHAMHGEMNHGEQMHHGEMEHGEQMHHGEMHHGKEMHHGEKMDSGEMVEYEKLRALESTALPAGRETREVHLALTGDMERYAWSFNNRVLGEADKILIRRGENVRFVLANETMMHHPVHLHGHFFRVLNGQDDHAPLKHTVNVPAMQTVTIEFDANEEKDWFFHCHNLYHMKAGMSRIIAYENTTAADADTVEKLFPDEWYAFADFMPASNYVGGELRAENTRNTWELEYEWDYKKEYELEAKYGRYLNRFWELYIGAELEREPGHDSDEGFALIGAHVLLPLLIELDLRLDSDGHGRAEFGSRLQLTDRAAFAWEVNTDDEYRLGLEYEVNKRLSVTANYDDQFDWGFGLMLNF